MKHIKNNTAIELLRKLAVSWKADFTETINAATLVLDNPIGKGSIRAYDITPALSVRVYDISFTNSVKFVIDENSQLPIYFLYCLKGYFYHKFKENQPLDTVPKLTNFIVNNNGKDKNYVVFPKNIHLQFSAITINKNAITKEAKSSVDFLDNTLVGLREIMNGVGAKKHFGNFNLDAAQYVKLLIKNSSTDTVGRLAIQAAVLSTLSTQLQAYQTETRADQSKPKLRDAEVDTIIGLNTYISSHIGESITVEMLAKESGLNINKLQKGFRYLYNDSVNVFVKKVKLEHAKVLMRTTDFSISQIVFAIGFSSKSYFSKIFKEYYGLLPSAYKKAIGQTNGVFELSYKSVMAPEFTSENLKDILVTSRDLNSSRGITGCLVTFEKQFFQFLEGPKNEVMALYERIKNDVRHHEVEIIWKGAKSNRIFNKWSMALVSDEGTFEVETQGILKHINIKDILGNLEAPDTIKSELVWKRIRNLIKVA